MCVLRHSKRDYLLYHKSVCSYVTACVCVCVCVGVGVSIAEPLHRADFRRKLEGPDAALLLHILHSTWKHL